MSHLGKSALLLIVLFCFGLTGAAHEGLQHLVGTVQAVSAGTVQVKTTDGVIVIVQLRPETRYLKDEREANATDIKKGARVVVESAEEGGRQVARLVRIGVVKPLSQATGGGAPQSHAGHPGGEPSRDDIPAREVAARPPADQGPATHGAEQHAPQPEPPASSPESAAGEAQMAGHGMAEGMAMDQGRKLFQSDMSRMAGMTPREPIGAMPMPDWEWMSTGIARLQYNRQGGRSGDHAVESTNWTMLMGRRDLGPGRLTLMMMNSFEPATLSSGGTAQLFQSGETFQGRPLVDRQHPHDFFMNLSATYRVAAGEDGACWVQLAPRGEPALGPTAFMHRASAGENPTAVLGHHSQDSTHITDGVITAGIGWKRVSLEASGFHGAEPDEGRWDLDPGELDSAAGRLKLSLGKGWSAQVSHGFLSKPEALEEGDVRRTTASLHYGEKGDRPFAASFVWGRNREEHGTFDGYLVEAAYQLTATDHFYARAERVDRELHLLETKSLGEQAGGLPGAGDDDIVGVGAFTLGYLKDLEVVNDVPLLDTLHFGLGADLTLYEIPSGLQRVYGDSPVSVHGFLRLRWGLPHGNMGAHGMRH